jgi:hypothetical protein
MAHLPEQGGERPRTQLIAPVADRAVTGQIPFWIRPHKAQPTCNLAHHSTNRHVGVDAHHDDQEHGHNSIEFALPLGHQTEIDQYGPDRFRGYRLANRLHCQMRSELAFRLKITYLVSHGTVSEPL